MDAHQAGEFQYRMTQILEAQIEMEAMKAENKALEFKKYSPRYEYDHFVALINKHGIHHNAAVEAQRAILR